MNRNEHLITIIGEECNEVGQRCSKILRFGENEIQVNQDLTNSARFIQELNDLIASVELYFGSSIKELIDDEQIFRKKAKIEKYLKYSKECGTLTDE